MLDIAWKVIKMYLIIYESNPVFERACVDDSCQGTGELVLLI